MGSPTPKHESEMKLKRLLLLGLTAILIILTVQLVEPWRFFRPRPNPNQIPVYPHAQQIQTYPPKEVGRAVQWTTAFQTTDSPEEVFKFYQQAFSDAGWELDTTFSVTGIRLSFFAGGCPLYYV